MDVDVAFAMDHDSFFLDVVSRNDNWRLRNQRSWFACHLACNNFFWGRGWILVHFGLIRVCDSKEVLQLPHETEVHLGCTGFQTIKSVTHSKLRAEILMGHSTVLLYDVRDELIFHEALGSTKFDSWGKSFWVNRCALSQRFELQSCQWKYNPFIFWDSGSFVSLA